MIDIGNTDIQVFIGNTEIEVYIGATKIYPSGPTPIDYSTKYFTIEALSAGTINLKSIDYSTDDGSTWTSVDTAGITVNVAASDKLSFRKTTYMIWSAFTSSQISFPYNVEGNIMSLLYGDNFSAATAFNGDSAFRELFTGSSVVNAENLVLPATRLRNDCYLNLFKNCTSLTKAPKELPALELADFPSYANSCYKSMFEGCTALTTTPTLPATTLSSTCYRNMFKDCTSLTTAPALPATTLITGCYQNMFLGCTSLTTAPELPAHTIASGAYQYMFSGCTNLNYIKCLAEDGITASNCKGWVGSVASAGTFVAIADTDWVIDSPNGVPVGWTVQDIGHSYKKDYLTFEILSAGTIGWTTKGTTVGSKTIEYSINDGAWTSISSPASDGSSEITGLQVGDLVRMRGSNDRYAYDKNSYATFSGSTAIFDVYGNIMSLTDGDNFSAATAFTTAFTFCSLFKETTSIHSAENLMFPVLSLSASCYRAMFSFCSNLTKAPKKLPATTLADYCYYYMFQNCPITNTPTLPATTVLNYSYSYMFTGCSSITSAPDLPATSVSGFGYNNMFRDCTGLTEVPIISASTLATRSFDSMFYGCSSITGTTTLKAASTVGSYCYNSMFRGCTGLTEATIYTTASASSMYQYMFYGCSSLNYIKCMSKTYSSSMFTQWVNGVAATGTFVRNSATTNWGSGVSGIPTNWTVQTG